MTAPAPLEIKLHQIRRTLELVYDDGRIFQLPCEYLRVYSPSAEVCGHGPGQEVLQTGKEQVSINAIRPVGGYGICPTFSDGHNTGIYTWETLYDLCVHQRERWGEYLHKLKEAGYERQQA
ncbi:DUF971 domain-containing protein [Candidatus Methylospira mobilis]|uniref:DUF971 domain-containing protein n=1 Tax=Candidatus Methylospira mobilis TaxID=1808979 RepID=A0A5Q0BLX6_9GAMM|nr:DUF971 domain-containing protein [Candidatus Methylospira mobilis]QFY44925.1 DUF971 domain-containing protein [Candidatus Methylospira mobilis]WNV06690.1 DUF971 domain-containing protein [Candidatus Methylospira mobilis]